ncbi:MAG: aminotransferase DegT [Legionellales bacterium]|nr:aminotransferase DegT [Legionellales bacterium]OUX66235.1 MAG: aminotransferase DegT [Gammaproteobacteria bacterium TMED281]
MVAKETVSFAKKIYSEEFIPLHRPIFEGNERKNLIECIDSNFVSSVGQKVTDFENMIADFTGSNYAVATVNGTSALHVALEISGIGAGDEVITQALTFIATCNSIHYARAIPVFIDVDKDTMGMSPSSLKSFLEKNARKQNGQVFNKNSGRRIRGCLPMHTFGFPCRIIEIAAICDDWGIALIEDAAESLGSYVNNRHTGTFGKLGTFSFNGNKVITTGGGGMIVTNDFTFAQRAKHITTTAKIPHAFNFEHDEIGYNYRMPNLNAALGCAQVEQLEYFLHRKSELAKLWDNLYQHLGIKFMRSLVNCKSNHWLITIILENIQERDYFLEFTNKNGVMCRPIWNLMSNLSMFSNCERDDLKNSKWLQDRGVNIPSSVPVRYSE